MMTSRSKFIEWKYLERKDDGKIYCKLCNNTCGTSMTRSRDHLLDIVGGMGGGVITCTKILQYVKEILCEEMNAHKQEKGQKMSPTGRENVISSTPSSPPSFMAYATPSMPYGSQREPTLSDVDPTQLSLKKAWKRLERNKVDDAVYDFFIGCNISFNTIKSQLFKDMLNNVGHFGPSYVVPSFESLRTKGVERIKHKIEERVKAIRDSWAISGCTLISDGWIDFHSKPLVDTLACFPQGVIHFSTIDCMQKKVR
jgi:hypothetical protein